MAKNEAKDDGEAEKPAEDAKPKKKLNPAILLPIVNFLAVAGVLGLAVYTKIIYKKPPITENTERERIKDEIEKEPKEIIGKKALLSFDPFQATLRPTQIGVQVEGGPPVQLKQHYLNVTLSIEVADEPLTAKVKDVQAKFMDALLRHLSSTTVDELATVQGRFILRSKIVGILNELTRKNKTEPAVVTNVYFSEFIVQ